MEAGISMVKMLKYRWNHGVPNLLVLPQISFNKIVLLPVKLRYSSVHGSGYRFNQYHLLRFSVVVRVQVLIWVPPKLGCPKFHRLSTLSPWIHCSFFGHRQTQIYQISCLSHHIPMRFLLFMTGFQPHSSTTLTMTYHFFLGDPCFMGLLTDPQWKKGAFAFTNHPGTEGDPERVGHGYESNTQTVPENSWYSRMLIRPKCGRKW